MFGRIRFTHISVVVGLLMFGAFGALAQDGNTVPATSTVPAGEEYKQVPISLDVQEAEIGTVLRSMAGFSGQPTGGRPGNTYFRPAMAIIRLADW